MLSPEELTVSQINDKALNRTGDFGIKSNVQVLKIEKKKNQSGKFQLNIQLGDITGSVNGIKFINNDDDEKECDNIFQIGNVIEVQGVYSGKWKNLTIKIARNLSKSEYELKNFVKSPKINFDSLKQLLRDSLNKIKNPHLRQLMKLIFNDNVIKEKFLIAPAAKKYHHNYTHGLLEHTIGMLQILESQVKFYGEDTVLDLDLLRCGILVHDLGKIEEYGVRNGVTYYLTEFQYLGHLVLGDRIVKGFMDQIEDFPNELKSKVSHIILSHHGPEDWGSKIPPRTPEAEVIHQLDMLDSRYKNNFLR